MRASIKGESVADWNDMWDPWNLVLSVLRWLLAECPAKRTSRIRFYRVMLSRVRCIYMQVLTNVNVLFCFTHLQADSLYAELVY